VTTLGHNIGAFFCWSRDHVARGLIAIGVTPNVLTVLGMLLTVTAATMLGLGWWMLAGSALVAAGACDMLDGAVARLGRKFTVFGGILDSTCDRVGDLALTCGLCFYFLVTWPGESPPNELRQPNLTYGLLAMLAMVNVTLISYIKARAEDTIRGCDVGFWKRGERYAAVLIGAFAANPGMILWELGLWAGLTALYRLVHAKGVLDGRNMTARRNLLAELVFFDRPRGSWSYDVHTGLAIALLVFARLPETDLLRAWLG
jgi:phosphatidylglycerophosphate synthase